LLLFPSVFVSLSLCCKVDDSVSGAWHDSTKPQGTTEFMRMAPLRNNQHTHAAEEI
jgi:hypothetical protein